MIQYFTDNLWFVWLIVSLICLLTELTNGDFYVICFAFGALVSIFAAAIGTPLWFQIIVWVVASLAFVMFVRPTLVNWLHGEEKERRSNADALIGKQGRVIEFIPADGHGYVKIDGDEWRSVTLNGDEIPVGTIVRVVSRDSIVLTVERI